MKLMDWIERRPVWIGFGSAGGAATLDIQADADSIALTASDELAAATALQAGVMTAADRIKLDGLSNTTLTLDPASFATRAQAELTDISAPEIRHLRTAGYADPGDGGGALYVRALSEPAHAGKLRSFDGSWWELVPGAGLRPEQFGAKGDGIADDAPAITAAISSGLGKVVFRAGHSYRLASSLVLTGNNSGLIGEGGYALKSTLRFDDGVGVCILQETNKFSEIRHLTIDMTAIGGDCCGLLFSGVWNSRVQDVHVDGPGATDPGTGQVSYGIVLRNLYGTLPYTPHPAAAALDQLHDAAAGLTFGCYYNNFQDLRIAGCGYGLALFSREEDGGGTSRVNQDMFLSCNIQSNWYGIWMQGCGGGHSFIDVSVESSAGDSVTIEDQANGTAPCFIGGEMSAAGEEFIGPALLLNVTGVTAGVPNASGEQATHLRASGGSTQIFGQKATFEGLIEPEFSGTETLAAGAVFDVTATRSDLGSNAIYYIEAVAQGSGHAESARVLAVGTGGAVSIFGRDVQGSQVTWQVTGDRLQIVNGATVTRTIEYRIFSRGLS